MPLQGAARPGAGNCQRRVVAKAYTFQGANPRFIVTSLTPEDAKGTGSSTRRCYVPAARWIPYRGMPARSLRRLHLYDGLHANQLRPAVRFAGLCPHGRLAPNGPARTELATPPPEPSRSTNSRKLGALVTVSIRRDRHCLCLPQKARSPRLTADCVPECEAAAYSLDRASPAIDHRLQDRRKSRAGRNCQDRLSTPPHPAPRANHDAREKCGLGDFLERSRRNGLNTPRAHNDAETARTPEPEAGVPPVHNQFHITGMPSIMHCDQCRRHIGSEAL